MEPFTHEVMGSEIPLVRHGLWNRVTVFLARTGCSEPRICADVCLVRDLVEHGGDVLG